jgi:hypothetical protein
MNAKRVVIKGLNYVGYVIDYGAVFCTVRLLSGTLVFVPRNLIQGKKMRGLSHFTCSRESRP